MMELSRLRAIREGQALSIRALGLRSGVSPATILRAEQGKGTYPATVRKLAKALSVTPAELRGEPSGAVSRPYPGPGIGNPNLPARRAATAERPTALDASLERAHALAEARWARAEGDDAGAARWEQIASRIAAGIAASTEGT